jgi:hypothetical protein
LVCGEISWGGLSWVCVGLGVGEGQQVLVVEV